MGTGLTRVMMAPAADVTDLDEWFAALDAAVHVEGDARWTGDRHALVAELPDEEATNVLETARKSLGDALYASAMIVRVSST